MAKLPSIYTKILDDAKANYDKRHPQTKEEILAMPTVLNPALKFAAIVEDGTSQGLSEAEVYENLEDAGFSQGPSIVEKLGTGLIVGVGAVATGGVLGAIAGGGAAVGGGAAAASGLGKVVSTVSKAIPVVAPIVKGAANTLLASSMENPGPPVASAPASSKVPAWLMPVAIGVGILLLIKKLL